MKIIDAGKLIKPDQINIECTDSHIVKEIDIMLKLHNPHLLHIHDLIVDAETKEIYLIMHLGKESMQDVIDKTNTQLVNGRSWQDEISAEKVRRWAL